MKRLSQRRRARSIRTARKRVLRREARFRRHQELREEAEALRTFVDQFTWLPMPRRVEIETEVGRYALMHFLADLRSAAFNRAGRLVRIDFSETRAMTAAGTLLFAAELARIKAIGGHLPLSCTYPRDPVVAQVLQHVGVFDQLGQRRTCKITADNVRYWKIHSGEMVDGQQVDQAMAAYKHLFSTPGQHSLYRGLTEAVANCRHHAYTEDRGDGLPTVAKWWMFSQQNEGEVTVALADLGIGIPRSLPRNDSRLAKVLAFLAVEGYIDNDGNRIRGAMALGASRTKQNYRGKGLADIRAVLDGLKGRLQIHSNSGFLAYDAGTKEPICKTFEATESIMGTIVLWRVPVPAQAQP